MSHAPFIPAYCNLALAIIKEEASSVSHVLDIFQRAANGPVDLALVLFDMPHSNRYNILPISKFCKITFIAIDIAIFQNLLREADLLQNG